MITNVIILLVIVAVIAGIVSLVGSSGKGVQESINVKEEDQDYVPVDTTEQLEDSLGTLSDRALAALQYQRLEDSFNKNCADAKTRHDITVLERKRSIDKVKVVDAADFQNKLNKEIESLKQVGEEAIKKLEVKLD